MRIEVRRLLGPGPVFVYESIIASRRWQGFAVRSLFVLFLLGALLVVAVRGWKDRIPETIRGLSQLGELIFVAVIGTQLTLVLLAAPAATAGAICLDRARGTLTHLLVTDLSDGEIVLGKLAARLTPILGLLACTLPVMELVTLLGGVQPDALLKAFVVTLGVAVLGCCLALVFSLWARKTHEALLATYAVWGLWLLGNPMLGVLSWATGYWFFSLPRGFEPYELVFGPYWRPASAGWEEYLTFLGGTLGISTALSGLAVRRVRAICTRDVAAKPARRHPRTPARAFPKFTRWRSQVLRWQGPTLDSNPVLWREWHRNRPAWWTRVVVALFVTLAVVFSMVAIVTGGRGEMAAFVNAFQVSVGLLLLSVSAATSLAEERVRGSLDLLMATPLSSTKIVIGKWIGTYRHAPALAILPGLVMLGASVRTHERWTWAVWMLAYVLASCAAITSLGLAIATWCPRLGRAVGLTVSLNVVLSAGWLMLIHDAPGASGLMMASPFYWAGLLTAEATNQFHGEPDHLAAGIFWTVVASLLAVAFFVVTLATFNRCLGRIESLRIGRIVAGDPTRLDRAREARPSRALPARRG
jgi:ABC-type transport system involved in multi-copper enzyme maturation permease subunit